MSAAPRGVGTEEEEKTQLWVDAQISTSVCQLSTHPHTCTLPQSPQQRPTHIMSATAFQAGWEVSCPL